RRGTRRSLPRPLAAGGRRPAAPRVVQPGSASGNTRHGMRRSADLPRRWRFHMLVQSRSRRPPARTVWPRRRFTNGGTMLLFSERSLWTMIHGIGLGGAALLALAAA